ncbi:thiocillin family RiPP [Streptococcus suis]
MKDKIKLSDSDSILDIYIAEQVEEFEVAGFATAASFATAGSFSCAGSCGACLSSAGTFSSVGN